MQYISRYTNKMGEILLASDGKNLIGLWFVGQKYFAGNLDKDTFEKDLPIFEKTKQWLDVYFSGKAPCFTPPLSFGNISTFRKRVWEIMLEIPFGQTSTYGKIARKMEEETGKMISARAIGGAVGHNSISLIIPCHRVLGSNFSVTGYAGGIDKKIKLLKLEGVDSSKLTVPKDCITTLQKD